MNAIVLIVPGSIETRTGGYEYDRRMIAALRTRGWTVAVLEINGGFPDPSPETTARFAAFLAAIPEGAVVVVDGLAYSAMPAEVEREAKRLRFVPIVHMPLAHDTGLSRERARELEQRERRALAAARLVVVTGRNTVPVLENYGVPPARIALIEPGTVRAPLAQRAADAEAVRLLCVGTVIPGKGHDVLVRALASIPERNWQLTCAGSLDRHPAFVNGLRDFLHSSDLEGRVLIAGEVDYVALQTLYESADLFVLATLHETYGLAVAEALAHGIPVVSTATGAIPDLLEDEGGIVVPPGDVNALSHAISSALDPRVRARLAAGARRVRERLRSWDDAAAALSGWLQKVAS